MTDLLSIYFITELRRSIILYCTKVHKEEEANQYNIQFLVINDNNYCMYLHEHT